AAGDLLVMHPGAVGLERGLALLDDVGLETAAHQRLARRAGQRAKRVVDEGNETAAVAADDDVALGFEKALGPLLDLLELPIAIGQLLDALGERAQLGAQRDPARQQETDAPARGTEQRRGADREQIRIVIGPGAARAGQEAERHRKRHGQDEGRPQQEHERLPAEQPSKPSHERPHVAPPVAAALEPGPDLAPATVAVPFNFGRPRAGLAGTVNANLKGTRTLACEPILTLVSRMRCSAKLIRA